MRWKLVLCSALATTVSVVSLGCDSSVPVAPPAPAEPVTKSSQVMEARAEPPAEIEFKPKTYTFGFFRGKVTAIGPDWVELGAGWRGYKEVGGKHDEGNDKPIRLSALGSIAGGELDETEHPAGTYRLTDLKVGDSALIETAVTGDKRQFCFQIIITRRPGRTIPPMPGDRFAKRPATAHLQSHVRYQAEQDWEEKGIPIPDEYLDKWGQAPWTNPPYLPPMRAPMPREVKPAIPLAKP